MILTTLINLLYFSFVRSHRPDAKMAREVLRGRWSDGAGLRCLARPTVLGEIDGDMMGYMWSIWVYIG